jgi:hypothetical protein
VSRPSVVLYVAGMAVAVAYAFQGGAGLAFLATMLMLGGLVLDRDRL